MIGTVLTGGLGLVPIMILIGIISVIWAAVAVGGYNKKIMEQVQK